MCTTILEFVKYIRRYYKIGGKKKQKEIERIWKHTPKKNQQFDEAHIIHL